jgi:Ca2+-binding EF-hand superfamily protein
MNRTVIRNLAVVSLLGLSWVGAAQAASGSPQSISASELTQEEHSALFQQLDRNVDGVIDQEEAAASAQISGAFQVIDRDADGRIDPSEWRDYVGPQRSPETQTE